MFSVPGEPWEARRTQPEFLRLMLPLVWGAQGCESGGCGVPHLEGKVPVLLRELVDFPIHLALLGLQVLALLQGLVQARQQAAGEESIRGWQEETASNIPPKSSRDTEPVPEP